MDYSVLDFVHVQLNTFIPEFLKWTILSLVLYMSIDANKDFSHRLALVADTANVYQVYVYI